MINSNKHLLSLKYVSGTLLITLVSEESLQSKADSLLPIPLSTVPTQPPGTFIHMKWNLCTLSWWLLCFWKHNIEQLVLQLEINWELERWVRNLGEVKCTRSVEVIGLVDNMGVKWESNKGCFDLVWWRRKKINLIQKCEAVYL